MEPLEAWETLRTAFTEGPFNAEVDEFKCAGLLDMEAIRWEENSEPAENSRRELVVERWKEACLISLLLSLCLGSLELGSIPIWEQQALCHRIAGKWSVGLVDFMVRERMPCRRSSGRGASSRPPAVDSHHHCCCCYCHRRRGATPIKPGQAVEVGNCDAGEPMLPAFGSVIFSLGSSRGNPGINTHISVLFTNTPEGNEEGSPLVRGEDGSERGKEKLMSEEPSNAAECSGKGKGKCPLGETSSVEGTSEAACPLPPSHSCGPESPSPQQKPIVARVGSPEDQWGCTIEEEKPKD